jgi:hypothetical protein
MKELTLGDIVKFILDNRGDSDAFKGWSEEEIAREVSEGVREESFVVDCDVEGNILGVILCEKNIEYKILHVKAILIKKPAMGTMQRFLKEFYKRCRGYDLTANRNGKPVRYKQSHKVFRLLNNLA